MLVSLEAPLKASWLTDALIWLAVAMAFAAGMAAAEGTVGAHGGGYGPGGGGYGPGGGGYGPGGYQLGQGHPFGPYLSGYQFGFGYGNEGFGSVMQYVYSHIGYNPGYTAGRYGPY